MKRSEHTLIAEEYDSIEELNPNDLLLLNQARAATKFAYAPYSNFNVGAVAKLSNGEIVTGSNQENASFPAGLCAERVLLASAASQHPGVGLQTVAISYNNINGTSDTPASPCGICRQSLLEYQHRFVKPIRLILSGMEGKVIIIDNAAQLLPLAFSVENLQ